MRTLDRSRQHRCVVDAVVRPLMAHVFFGPKTLDENDRLLHTVDARLRRVVRDAELVVVTRLPAGADAELEPAAAKKVEGRRLPREQNGVAVVVCEDEAADSQGRGRFRRRGERRDQRELVGDVIGHEQRVVAQRFRTPRDFAPMRC